MHDKVVLITGGNAGIGLATATALARRGARIFLACRSADKGQKAVAQLRTQTGNNRIHFLPLDLANLDSVSHAAGLFRGRSAHLDVLINNAGIFTSDLQYTADGFEMQFGVNHLGHFLLTRQLLPALQAAPQPRVINVASIAYLHGRFDFDRLRSPLDDYNGLQAYAQSKLANVLFTRELARRYPGIDSNCLHPGVVRTAFGNKHSRWYLSLFWHFYKPFMIKSERGARTSVYLAADPEVQGTSGVFFDEKLQPRSFAGEARNDLLAHRLWEVSCTFVEPWLKDE